MIFSKAILPFLLVTAAVAKDRTHRRLGRLTQGDEEEPKRRLTGKGGKGSPQFIYKQSSEDSALELIDGGILSFSSLCTDTMCYGAVDAILSGYTIESAHYVTVNLSHSTKSSSTWEFACPSTLQTPSLEEFSCSCLHISTGPSDTCNIFIDESNGDVGGSRILVRGKIDNNLSCFEGYAGTAVIKCQEIPVPPEPPVFEEAPTTEATTEAP
jgi:hypothetical protein